MLPISDVALSSTALLAAGASVASPVNMHFRSGVRNPTCITCLQYYMYLSAFVTLEQLIWRAMMLIGKPSTASLRSTRTPLGARERPNSAPAPCDRPRPTLANQCAVGRVGSRVFECMVSSDVETARRVLAAVWRK